MELRCPLCRSERIVVVLRTQLILCRQCGWRWLEEKECADLGLADVTKSDAPPHRRVM